MIWLCLHFSQLPLETFARSNQHAADLPSVIIDKHRVWLCNAQAEQAGITQGMPGATAHALCQQLLVVNREPAKEAMALTQLAHWAYAYTPAVTLHGDRQLLLEVGSVLRLFGSLDVLLKAIQADLTEMGYSCNAGLAHTPKAAQLMAKFSPGNHQQYFDSNTGKLNSQTLKQTLGQAPIDLLDCPPKQIEKLHRLGLQQFNELLVLPINAVGRRFGKEFLRYIAQLRGDISDPQIAITPPQQFARDLYFYHGIKNTEALLFPMQRLLGEFCRFLQQNQVQCHSFVWTLSSYKQQHSLPIRCSLPCHNHDTFLALSKTALENFTVTEAIEGVRLQCSRFVALEQPNQALFVDEKHRKP